MRLSHWETFAPICPRCLQDGTESPLRLAEVFVGGDEVVEQGLIHCTHIGCQQESPIIDGIPFLLPNVREYVDGFFGQINAREDLAPGLESLVGDCTGQDSAYDVERRLLSAYVWDGYEPASGFATSALLRDCRGLSEALDAPVLDIGCGVGRSTFDLADVGPVLGVDMNFSFLRFAQAMRRSGEAGYSLRTRGISYEPRRVSIDLESAENVDFWLADAAALPFRPACVSSAVALNVLDAVASPEHLLRETLRVLCDAGRCLLATPFDWSTQVTPLAAWIGGHSQRSDLGGEPIATFKYFLEQITLEADSGASRLLVQTELDGVPWRTRLHERSTNEYLNYTACLVKRPV